MILKSFLQDPHLKNGSERLSHRLKTLRHFGEGEIRLPLRCFFQQNHFPSGEDPRIMEKSSVSKVALDVPTWKWTSFMPFHLFSSFSFLRSQKNWAHKLKSPFSCLNLCNHIHWTEPWGLETLRTSKRSYFHPDELFGCNFFPTSWTPVSFSSISVMKAALFYLNFFFLKNIYCFLKKKKHTPKNTHNTPLSCIVYFLRCTSGNVLGK